METGTAKISKLTLGTFSQKPPQLCRRWSRFGWPRAASAAQVVSAGSP